MKRKVVPICWYSQMISELLSQLRMYANLSPKELAARAGISEHTISTCERYCGYISMNQIRRFVQGVGFDYLAFLYEVEVRMELAGMPLIPGEKNPRPSVFFKPLYDVGRRDSKEVNRQLRIMRQLREPAADHPDNPQSISSPPRPNRSTRPDLRAHSFLLRREISQQPCMETPRECRRPQRCALKWISLRFSHLWRCDHFGGKLSVPL